MRYIFLENLCTKCGGETSPRNVVEELVPKLKFEHISGSTGMETATGHRTLSNKCYVWHSCIKAGHFVLHSIIEYYM